MAQKAPYQSFETSWAKTLNWAHGQGIPTTSVLPVYEMDAKRMLAGQGTYAMSEAERTRAILASYNPNNVTPLPTDKPAGGVTGFFHNLEHDASNIFTGLQPTHLVTSIYDSVKNTVEHPGWLFDPTKNTIAQLVPGVSLIGEFEQGGIDNVLAHPLITALNVLGLASAGTSLIGHTVMGDVLAEALKVPGGRTAIGGREGLGPLGIARTAVGNIGTKEMGFARTAAGEATLGGLTVSQRVKNWTNTKGMGSDVAGIAQEVHGRSQAASARFKDLVSEFTVANAKLGGVEVAVRDERMAKLFSAPVGSTMSATKAAYNLVTQSGRSFADLRVDDSVPVAIKELLPHYQAASDWLAETGLASGKLTKLLMPDGTMQVYSSTGAEAKAITGARDRLDAAEAKVDKLAQSADRIAKEIQHNDTIAEPGLGALADIGGQVQVAIKGSLMSPSITGELADRLRSTLPADQMWERLNVNQANVAKLLGVGKVTLGQARAVNEIFGTGGLIDQIAAAYQKEDFVAFRDLSKKLRDKLNSKQLGTRIAAPKVGPAAPAIASPVMAQVRQVAENLYTYGSERQKAEVALSKELGGRYAVGAKGRNSALHAAVLEHQRLQAAFEKAVWRHPAPVWQPTFVRLVNNKIAADESSALALDKALAGVARSEKMDQKTLAEIRSDPGRVIALIRTFADASLNSPFGAVDRSLIEKVFNEARDEIVSLRAQGFEPHYVPNFSSRHTLGGYDPSEGTFNVRISPARYMTPDAVRERLMDQSNTIYDIGAGMTRAMKQQVQSDATQAVIDDYLIPTFGYKQSELMPLIAREHPDLGLAADAGTRQAYLAHIMESTYGMGRFDPATYGLSSGSRHITGDETIWMPTTIINGLRDVTEKSQGEVSGLLATPTKIFRTSVLGYSPRFVAHILFGGSFLQALREPASFLRMGEAYRMLKDPEFRAAVHTRSTQIGADSPVSYGVMEFHREGGKTMGRMWAHEMMDKLGLPPDKMTSWLQVIPQMTFKLTNTITDMQRSMVVLQGIRRAQRRGRFVDPVSGKMLDMTDARALEEGVKAANKVMGDLSHMTPLERNVITTVVPFYGWTKHVLQYVATYPVDHPYRAVFLAYLANMNSDSVSKGLYTRIQNFFFLGSPDAQGNVSAVDVRALNPLRDVANYATLGGLVSMLNPAVSAPFAMIDPEVVFGGNVLYPNLTYNHLYGTETAAPAGSALTAAEQFVPELGALDASLGLSSQYRNLAKSNPNSFTKAIFGALNIPFAQVQHLNVKQIAASQEIDRYRSASQAATQAWQSGNFGALGGYGEVPNPLQLDYNISPAQLQAIYQAALSTSGGLAPSEVVAPLPTPAGL